MGWLDKLLGRGKQAAGDVTGDTSMKAEGSAQEAEGEAEDVADAAEDKLQEAREEVAEQKAKRDPT
jgi:uncharacterized protein YjbJ (UPF0337 family)